MDDSWTGSGNLCALRIHYKAWELLLRNQSVATMPGDTRQHMPTLVLDLLFHQLVYSGYFRGIMVYLTLWTHCEGILMLCYKLVDNFMFCCSADTLCYNINYYVLAY